VTDGPVETFLAELDRRLGRDDVTRRRILAEVGDHLRDLVAEGRARGLDEHTSELEAVDRFGSARAFARGVRPGRRRKQQAGLGIALVAAGVCAGLALATLRTPSPTMRAQRITFRPATGAGKPVARVVVVDPRSGRVLAVRLGFDSRYLPGFTTHAGAIFIGGSSHAEPFGDLVRPRIGVDILSMRRVRARARHATRASPSSRRPGACHGSRPRCSA
jgi:hypothetical protein